MTLSTVVAGLLPIMWSTRTGAEVMKPLATPVLGGMVSSLLHVLIVTPVIFTWLRERKLLRKKAVPAALTLKTTFCRHCLQDCPRAGRVWKILAQPLKSHCVCHSTMPTLFVISAY